MSLDSGPGEGNGNGAAAAAAPVSEPVRPENPEPEIEILSVEAVARVMAPTLNFRIRVDEPSKRPIFMIALSAVITVEPSKRSYDDATRAKLIELFGEPERWATTTVNFRWTAFDTLVPAFTESTEIEVAIPCTYDLEVAATKYFYGLTDGHAPVRFHFSGRIYYDAGEGRLQYVQVPWDCSVRFSMPVEAWQGAIAQAYPFRGWVPLDTSTIDRLQQLKVDRGLPTFDAAVDQLLADNGDITDDLGGAGSSENG